jgi:hypothetical protein
VAANIVDNELQVKPNIHPQDSSNSVQKVVFESGCLWAISMLKNCFQTMRNFGNVQTVLSIFCRHNRLRLGPVSGISCSFKVQFMQYFNDTHPDYFITKMRDRWGSS